MDPNELGAWLRLLETCGIGREAARKLLAAFGSPQAVLAAPLPALELVVSTQLAKALTQPVDHLPAQIDKTLEWLAAAEPNVPRRIIALGDAAYPSFLLQAADPPLLVYAQGRVELLAAPSIAVVGSRSPTAQGKENAQAFSATLSEAGLTIVSGMAMGVDGSAHDGALKGSGSTIAVVGTGLDRVYPRRHLELAHRIALQGLILSEFALGTPPLSQNFPQRNRIISGLSRGTLVIEAALQSGSLITARLAAEAGRDVFAIPGSIHSPQSRGCHALIKQGAKLVESAQDVLDDLNWRAMSTPERQVARVEDTTDPLLDVMGFEPVTLDVLSARTGWSVQALNTRLLELELEGQVSRLPGQLFQRLSAG